MYIRVIKKKTRVHGNLPVVQVQIYTRGYTPIHGLHMSGISEVNAYR